MADRNYPLPRSDEDPRFTHGLLVDVAAVLGSAGYPSLTALDTVKLLQVLFDFVYEPEVER